VPEVIEDGVTGFIVSNEADAIDALKRVHTLDRGVIRERFEARFTAGRMAQDYLETYQSLMVPQSRYLSLVQ